MRRLSHQDTLVPWSCSKKNTTSAHSSTSFSVASPPSCKLSLHGCRDVGDPKRAHANTQFIIPLRTRSGTTRARVATSREKATAQTHRYIQKKAIWNKSPTSHYDICCYCIEYGSREIHAHTQWTCRFLIVSDVKLSVTEVFIPINSVERFDEKMGAAHLSSFFTVTSPPSCTCMVVETKGSCWACPTAQDRPSLSRRLGLRCAGSRKRSCIFERKKTLSWSWTTLCICMYSHTHTHTPITHTSTLQHLHWTSCHCIGHHDIALDIMYSYYDLNSHYECHLCCQLCKYFNCYLYSYEYCYYYDSLLCAHVQSELCRDCLIEPHFWSWTQVYCFIIMSHSDVTSSLYRH